MTEDATERIITHTAPTHGTPPVAYAQAEIDAALHSLEHGNGPIAVDAERASGFKYSQRAYLLQFTRTGSDIILLDPTTDASFAAFATAVNAMPWILHAATQDLPCLRDVGFHPTSVFDTELAAKLLGRERVGLGALLEHDLEIVIAKEHSAVDWSTRPIPEEWRAYAALDVEFLPALHDRLYAELIDRDRVQWYEEERALLLTFTGPEVRAEPWRRTSGIHAIRDARKQAVVRALWEARDARARELDISSGRVLHDSVIIDIASHLPSTQAKLESMRPVHNRNARKDPGYWWAAIEAALALPDHELPRRPTNDGTIPPPKAWPQRNPEAAVRWERVRPATVELAEALGIQPEVLIAPDTIRRLCWDGFTLGMDASEVADLLHEHGARPWQVQHVGAVISTALAD